MEKSQQQWMVGSSRFNIRNINNICIVFGLSFVSTTFCAFAIRSNRYCFPQFFFASLHGNIIVEPSSRETPGSFARTVPRASPQLISLFLRIAILVTAILVVRVGNVARGFRSGMGNLIVRVDRFGFQCSLLKQNSRADR